MCGRFARTSSQERLAAEFGVAQFVNVDLAPRYNIAPSLYVEAIVNDGAELPMGPMRWGFTDLPPGTGPLIVRVLRVCHRWRTERREP